MKKARIVLSGVALFALVGGALAFKAARFNGQPIWHPTTYISNFGKW
jgi:cytosine/uracil/thiamine/allantoin permease